MDTAVKASDSEGYIDNALRFHRRLVESSGNRTFLGVWDSLLWDIRGRIALRRLADQGKSLKPFVSMHKALLGRLRSQDVPGATECVQAVLERVSCAFEPETAAR
jgi:DNA-binding GntR family transcriptional regulator